MKDRPLSITETDETPMVINKPEKDKLLKEMQEIASFTSFYHNQLEAGKMTVGFNNTIISLLESHFIKVSELANYETFLKAESDKRHEQIASVNKENHQLRKQLGDKASGEDVRETIKNMTEMLSNFWKAEGFNFVKEVDCGSYGVKIIFSTSFSGIGYNKETEKIKLQELKDFGFQFCARDKGSIFMNDNNIEVLKTIFYKNFIDFDIADLSTSSYQGELTLNNITIYVRDYDTILALPYPTWRE